MGNFKSELKGLNRFQPIPRDLIQDCGLTAQARFIYAYMAAKPEGWEFWQDVMSREVGMSVQTLRKYLYELRNAGWLEIGSHKVEGSGRFGAVQYTLKALAESSMSENLPHGKNSTVENPPCGKISTMENLSHLNNTETLKDIDTLKKKKSVDTPAPLILPFSSDKFRMTWEALCEEKEWKKKSDNALRLTLKKLGKYDEAFAIELMERAIEGGWRGVVFNDTDAKYQEWKSARQLAQDNRQPRTTPAQGKPKQIDPNNQVDAFYREKQRKEEEERARLIAELKAKHGITDGDADKQASG